MPNLKQLISPELLACPEYIDEDGQHKKLDHFLMTENGVVPVYEETDEISTEDALAIMLGENE